MRSNAHPQGLELKETAECWLWAQFNTYCPVEGASRLTLTALCEAEAIIPVSPWAHPSKGVTTAVLLNS